VTITDRTVLIMDEVDGMSSGDRGGVGALNAMIKKSKVLFNFPCVPLRAHESVGTHNMYRERPRSAKAEAANSKLVQSPLPEVGRPDTSPHCRYSFGTTT
jgi:hypothetical protein